MDLSQRSDLTRSVHRSSGSFELVLGAVLFSLLGLVVDRSVGSTPLFVIVFAFAGFAGAAVSIYYRYRAQIEAMSPSPTRPVGSGDTDRSHLAAAGPDREASS